MQRFEKGQFVAIVNETENGASVEVYSTIEMSLMDTYELPEYQEFGSYDELISYSKENAIFDSDSSQIYFEHEIFGYFDEYDEEAQEENDEYSLSKVAEYYNDYIDDFDEYQDF